MSLTDITGLSLELDDFDFEGSSSPKQDKVKKDPVLEKIVEAFNLIICQPLCLEKKMFAEPSDIRLGVRSYAIHCSLPLFFPYKNELDVNHVQKFINCLDPFSPLELPLNLKYFKEKDVHEWQKHNFSGIAGLFLSDLLNQIEDKEISIDLTMVPVKLQYLAYRFNDKTLFIQGNAGSLCGFDADNLKIYAKSFGFGTGEQSRDCEFHAKEKIEGIAFTQKGTSRYFVKEEEISYKHW